jgi:hypothetical protein
VLPILEPQPEQGNGVEVVVGWWGGGVVVEILNFEF